MKVKLFLTSLLLIFSLSLTGCAVSVLDVVLSPITMLLTYYLIKDDSLIEGLYVHREQFIEEYLPRCTEEFRKLAEDYNFSFEEYTDPEEFVVDNEVYQYFYLYFYNEEFMVCLDFVHSDPDERFHLPSKIRLCASLYYWYPNKIDKRPDDFIKYETMEKAVNFFNDFCNIVGADAITDHNMFEALYYKAYSNDEEQKYLASERWINDYNKTYLEYYNRLYCYTKGIKNEFSELEEPHYQVYFSFHGNVKPLEDFGVKKTD